jgi:hypothetical protein
LGVVHPDDEIPCPVRFLEMSIPCPNRIVSDVLVSQNWGQNGIRTLNLLVNRNNR